MFSIRKGLCSILKQISEDEKSIATRALEFHLYEEYEWKTILCSLTFMLKTLPFSSSPNKSEFLQYGEQHTGVSAVRNLLTEPSVSGVSLP